MQDSTIVIKKESEIIVRYCYKFLTEKYVGNIYEKMFQNRFKGTIFIQEIF